MEDKIPDLETKQIDNFDDFLLTGHKMFQMQKTHNKLAEDFEFLKSITEMFIDKEINFQPLIRACIKEFFSLVEGDIYLINQYSPYTGYKDKDDFKNKFKKTFRHHSKTFKKINVKNSYQSTSYKKFYQLKLLRDQIVHPKSLDAVKVSIQDFENIVEVYREYRKYISQLMTNIGISTKIKI